ncbi:MAG: two-component system response regulator [Gammaproteobacteria bacterium]|nr:MAG: two-component system response regulator [Gammaproteobacteria bacterium]
MARDEGVLRLLLVDDRLTESDQTITRLRQAGHAVRASRLENIDEIEQALAAHSWDIVLCRQGLDSAPAKDVTNLIRRLGRDVPCIILASDPESVPDLYSSGAQDIICSSDHQRLPFAVNRELKNLFVRRLGRRNERALRESEKRAKLLLSASKDAVAYVHEGMYIYVNNAYLSLFDYEDEEDVDGLSILDMVDKSAHSSFKTAYREFVEQREQDDSPSQITSIQCIKENEDRFEANIEFSHAEVEGETCTQIIVRAVSAEPVAIALSNQATVSVASEIDALTGLYNRYRLMDELEKAVANADSGHGPSELLYLVIDEVQKVKEKIGLSASDILFKSVAELLQEARKEDEVLSRYSEQVFVIIIASGDDSYVDERAEVYRKIIDDYVSHVDGKMIDLQCSMGISRITESLTSPYLGIERADKACMQAQQAGGNRVVRYQPSTAEEGHENNDEAMFWIERVQDSIRSGSFCLNYQPIVSLHGKEQELYDVLLRIKQHDGSLIEADKFIEYIEDSEIMIEVDEWVISNAFRILAEQRKESPNMRFFIKLSKQTLAKPSFLEWIHALLAKHNIDGNAFVFEISETLVLDHLELAQNIIANLKEVGCEFCLEHFGSGLDFSHSLSVLDVDCLKINGDFVENMATDAENRAAVKAIIEMGKQAGKNCIAEYVSDANSLALLWRLGVDYAMGYYIQEPTDKLDYNFADDNL